MSDDYSYVEGLESRIAALERELAEARSGTARIWAVKYENAAAELTALRRSHDGATLAFQHALAEKDATIDALRQRHGEAVEKAFRAGYMQGEEDELRAYPVGMDAAWIAFEAKARLT